VKNNVDQKHPVPINRYCFIIWPPGYSFENLNGLCPLNHKNQFQQLKTKNVSNSSPMGPLQAADRGKPII
jgi:hypothetical protein